MAASMNSTRWRYQVTAAVPVLMVFAALFAWSIPKSDSTTFDELLWIGVLFALPTVFWLFITWLLVNRWWGRPSACPRSSAR